MVAVLFVGVAACVYYFATEGDTINTYAWGALALIVAIVGPISTLRRKQDTGESLAIKTMKRQLAAAGYDTFLTTRRYRSVRNGG